MLDAPSLPLAAASRLSREWRSSFSEVQTQFVAAAEDASRLQQAVEALVLHLWDQDSNTESDRHMLLRATSESALEWTEKRSRTLEESRRTCSALLGMVEALHSSNHAALGELIRGAEQRFSALEGHEALEAHAAQGAPEPRAPCFPSRECGLESLLSPILGSPDWQGGPNRQATSLITALTDCVAEVRSITQQDGDADCTADLGGWFERLLHSLSRDLIESRSDLCPLAECLQILIELVEVESEAAPPALSSNETREWRRRLASWRVDAFFGYPNSPPHSTEELAELPVTAALSGALSQFGLGETINLLHTGRHGGVLRVSDAETRAELILVDGEVVAAYGAEQVGAEVYFALLALEDAKFEFIPGSPAVEVERNVHYETIGLLVEGARRSDEIRRCFEGIDSSADEERSLRRRLLDPHRLGTLRLLDVKAFDRRRATPDRSTILLVGSCAQFVSRFLDQGLTLPADDLAALVGGDPRVLSLVFSSAVGDSVELLLVDERRIETLFEALPEPTVLLFAPSLGDLIPLGVESCTQVLRLLSERTPKLVLGLGDPALEESLRRSVELTGTSCALQVLPPRSAGELPALRRLVVECLDRVNALRMTSPQ